MNTHEKKKKRKEKERGRRKKGEYHVRVLVLIDNPSILELDIEVLINGVKGSSDSQIVLQLHRHFSSHQVFEIRKEQLHQS